MRETGHMVAVQTDALQDRLYLLIHILVRRQSMQFHAGTDDILDRHTRVQGRMWILEDHLHILAECFFLFTGVFKNIFSFIGNRACCRLIQLYQAPSRRGLATSALTYQSQRFPFINRKMHVINCFQHFSPADVEILAEIRDLEQGCAPINSFCHGVPSVSLPAEPQHFPLLPVSAPQSALS